MATYKINNEQLKFIIKESVSNRLMEYGGNHKAPSNNGDDEPIYNIENMFPDIYTNKALKLYGTYGMDDEFVIRQIQSLHNKPNSDVIIYRAVPKDIENIAINNGDWVTTSKMYANLHGKSNLGNNFKILKKSVKASQVYTDGNSIFEWGVYC